jgi:hypothetical protein
MIEINKDLELFLVSKEFRILNRNESCFVKSIRGIRDELSDEYLLLSVERIDNDVH